MKKTILFIVLGVMVASLIGCKCPQPVPQPSSSIKNLTWPKVNDAVVSVQRALDASQAAILQGDNKWDLKTAKITLQTVNDNRISTEVDWLIVALKGNYENSTASTLDLTLVPSVNKFLAFSEDTLAMELTKAILSAHSKIKTTYIPLDKGGSPLTTSEVSVTVSFVATWDVSGSVGKWALVPISISAGDEFYQKNTNTAVITFVPHGLKARADSTPSK